MQGEQLEHLPNLSFWAGALKMVRIVERPIEADDVKPNLVHKFINQHDSQRLFEHVWIQIFFLKSLSFIFMYFRIEH